MEGKEILFSGIPRFRSMLVMLGVETPILDGLCRWVGGWMI
jgi:hypothetical protein